eukprot:gene13436-14817_t
MVDVAWCLSFSRWHGKDGTIAWEAEIKASNVTSGGGVSSNILKAEEIIVQRLCAKVSRKAQEYASVGAREFIEFKHREITLENMKNSCEKHFKPQLASDFYYCDVLAGDQGPSCRSLSNVPDLKVIHIRFVKVSQMKENHYDDIADSDLSMPPLKISKRENSDSNMSMAVIPKSLPISITWASVPTDMELFIEDVPVGSGGIRTAFISKYQDNTLKIIADLGITVEQGTK